ncbi:hypothetical protein LLS1_00140 [Leifsonia sp. LS1]|uniref:hypothetical protein n=1 Tax=unclassified Leifsonia TaxID=2663824 RepID=UPI001CBC221B|nr:MULTISPECIES: hypothetical protein [unclassified Leifsonia]UAJ79621.1 hypothetical protein IT072_00470 [Leifsonia sp. ZF2019]GIT78345.1 hypothetical protein LLS1_00140 [Leifsonia sp. LS1]
MTPEFEDWAAFNTAVAGAGAALGGLLIVALSVNIRQIAESRGLAARAGASIAALILGVVLCCLGLIPGQQQIGFGVQVLVGTLLCAVLAVLAIRAIRGDGTNREYRRYDLGNILPFALPLVFFLAGGVLLIGAIGLLGMVLVAIGTILAIVGTVLFSWIALVEVLR